ncbi:hypothetical protein, partial [Paracoccus lichenicola]|uniref:hypothetical protein n=1 Tax=Paracoccus lichenicola TaxID=2665644 RepID=UPI001E5487F5
ADVSACPGQAASTLLSHFILNPHWWRPSGTFPVDGAFIVRTRIRARRKDPLMRLLTASLFGSMIFALAACGNTATERAATGGLGGAVIAGPAGAVVGGTVGAATAK